MLTLEDFRMTGILASGGRAPYGRDPKRELDTQLPDSNRQLETIRNRRNPFKIMQITFSNRPKKTGSNLPPTIASAAVIRPFDLQLLTFNPQKANKRLMETNPSSKLATIHSNQRTSLFLIETKNPFPTSTRFSSLTRYCRIRAGGNRR